MPKLKKKKQTTKLDTPFKGNSISSRFHRFREREIN